MQFSVIALTVASASVAIAASAISQIDDGQIQAPSSTAETASSVAPTTSASTVAPTTSAPTVAPSSNSTSSTIETQTENGANQVGGAALAGLVAVGAMLI